MALLVAVSARLLPFVLESKASVPDIGFGLILIHAGVSMRWAQALATLGYPSLLTLSSISGFPILAGLALWGRGIGHCVRQIGNSHHRLAP